MEWNNGTGAPQPVNKPAHAGSKRKMSLLNLRTASVGLIFCIAILLVLVSVFVSRGGSGVGIGEIKKNQMQAVFLNGGQVYFGKITDLNSRAIEMSDIYYLRVNQTVQPNQENAGQQTNANDISLVKLGCELHGPEDAMVINQEQVIFWENLKTDGQVAKAVDEYKKQNPDGQKCETATNNNQQNGTGTTPTTQNTGTGTGTNTNTNNTNTNTNR